MTLRVLGPLATGLTLAAIAFYAALWLWPAQAMSSLAALAPTNGIVHFGRNDAKAAELAGASSDLLISACTYDLSAGPLYVTVPVPKDTYWSVSGYGSGMEIFVTINDRQSPLDTVEFLLAPRGDRIRSDDLAVIRSPSTTGVLVMRTLVNDETRAKQLDEERRNSNCTTYKPPPPPEPPVPLPKPETG